MEALKRLPWAAKNSVFERLSQIADISSLSKEERLKYDEGIRKYRDTLCVMEGSFMKGRQEGRQEGEILMAKKIARTMARMGMSADAIREATGVNIAETDDKETI